jgi:hypothetical protein
VKVRTEVPTGTQVSKRLADSGQIQKVVSIETVLSGMATVDRFDLLIAVDAKDLEEPWSIVKMEGDEYVVSLPSNIREIAESNYLFAAGLKALALSNYKMYPSQKTWTGRFKPTTDQTRFLQAFCLPLFTGEIRAGLAQTGMVRKGLLTSLDVYLQGIKGFDRTYLKFAKQEHPSKFLFGDVWGKDYPREQWLVTKIIEAIRHQSDANVDYSKLWLSETEIKKRVKLDLPIRSKLYSAVEVSFLKDYLADEGIAIEYTMPIPTKEEGRDFGPRLASHISDRLKQIREIKTVLRDISERRLRSCYAPYKTVAERKRARKIPIETLKGNISGTRDYDDFNPTLFLTVKSGGFHLMPFDKKTKEWSEEIIKQKQKLRRIFKAKLQSGDGDRSLADGVLAAYEEFVQYTEPFS